MTEPESSSQQPEQSIRSSSDATQGTVVCSICRAVYAPSQSQAYLLQAPPVALESAFMSMCHFCFRCRRPACPACWDDVHGVCGECDKEANLPFRSSAPPLNGVLFSPSRQAQQTRTRPAPSSLVCVRPGRFQQSLSPSTDSSAAKATWQSVTNATSKRPIRKNGSKKRQKPETAASHSDRSSASIYADVAELETRPGRRIRTTKRIKKSIITLFFILLLLLASLIIVSEVSASANAFIISVLHVDIRAEIAYLLQLIKQHL